MLYDYGVATYQRAKRVLGPTANIPGERYRSVTELLSLVNILSTASNSGGCSDGKINCYATNLAR